MSTETQALRLHGVTVRYGAMVANRDIDLAVRAGSIHAVVGENGAGKSTLMKAIFGLVPLAAGEIRIHGQPLAPPSPMTAMQHGVGMVHQHFMLVDTLTVVENVILGHEPRAPGWRGWFGALDRRRAEEEVAALAERYHLLGSVVEAGKTTTRQATLAQLRRLVRDLSVGERQRVELLRVLYQQSLPRGPSHTPHAGSGGILILDEPTAVLTPPEVEELFTVLRGWVDGGGTLILVTHKLDEVMAIAQAVTVLRRGEVVARLETATTSAGAIARAMVGRDPIGPPPPAPERPGRELLAVEDLRTAVDARRGGCPVVGVSFTVRVGEIVGVAGVEGNGQTALVEALTGLQRTTAGTVHLCGAEVTRRSPAARRRLGLGLVPEDRHRRGLLLHASMVDNLLLGREATYADRLGTLDRGRLDDDARRLVTALDVRPTDITLPARALSGGNQQKLVLGRELSQKPLVLIAAQPTRGVDLAAIERIWAALAELRAGGCGVLLISSELEELLALCDRILVLLRGAVVATLGRAEASREVLGRLMTGVSGTAQGAARGVAQEIPQENP
jgi:ABC-type uncharacterized transport system ATPase subunit